VVAVGVMLDKMVEQEHTVVMEVRVLKARLILMVAVVVV
jgi:hypothetical protein